MFSSAGTGGFRGSLSVSSHSQNEWWSNHPKIDNGTLYQKQEEAWKLQTLGTGCFHKAFSIENGRHKGFVLKMPNVGRNDPQKCHQALYDDVVAYDYLLQRKAPLAKVMSRPDQNHEGYWVVERLTPVSTSGWEGTSKTFDELADTDQKLLCWVKEWLKRPEIRDLRPPNVGTDPQGNFKILDWFLPKEKGKNKDLEVAREEWAAGNPHIRRWLNEDFVLSENPPSWPQSRSIRSLQAASHFASRARLGPSKKRLFADLSTGQD